MIKAIVFDFDGVLVESTDIKTEAFRELFLTEGDEIAAKVVDYHCKNMGTSRFDKFRYIYREILERHLAEEEFHNLCQRFAGLVVDAVVKAPYVEGAREFLEKNAQNNYQCFIASATPQKEIEEIVKRRGMSPFFKAVYGAPKRKTDIVNEILSGYSFPPRALVFIGDALSDYYAANANGAYFIARTGEGDLLFKDINCQKIKNLTALSGIIELL